jgi:hypothetical protein
MSCLAKDPNHRPQSVEEILRVLKSIQECLKRGEQLVGEWGGKVDELTSTDLTNTGTQSLIDEICLATFLAERQTPSDNCLSPYP